MRVWQRFGVCVLLGAIPLAGCSSKKETPCVYERKIQIRDLASDAAPADNGFVLLSPDGTIGRFACGISVAKFALDGETGTVRFHRMSDMEEAAWADAIRGLSEVTNLQFLNPVDTVPNPPTLEYLCEAARDLRTSLVLIYAPNRFGPNSSQVLGVLYDAFTARPLATLHTSMNILDLEGVESPPDELTGDHRDIDAYYQASRAYEKQAVQCLAALIKQDTPAPATQPHSQWSTPPAQRWWIPRW